MPDISVIMPTYNSERFLADAIRSVQSQTWTDWELLIINEADGADATANIVQHFQGTDKRIYLVQNQTKLGLSASLNRGLQLAKGRYIARLDADDIAHPARFEKQIKYMDANLQIAICGTWQHHFGPSTDWIHKGAVTSEQCKANLLFFCDLCHSTLMLRREVLEKYHLMYDGSYLAEDFELWTRVVQYGGIVNLPDVLGEYRCSNENITHAKKEKLHVESGRIVAHSLKNNLNIDLSKSEMKCFNNWHNPVEDAEDKEQFLIQCKTLLCKIYSANQKLHFYDPECLLYAIFAKWRWLKFYEPFTSLKRVETIEEVFSYRPKYPFLIRINNFMQYNKGIKCKIKKIFYKLQQITNELKV